METLPEKILVIDDDKQLCELLVEYLGTEGFEVEVAHEGDQGMELAMSNRHCLVVLDVMLPKGQSGFAVLQHLRARTGIPILMLTARGEDVDRIVGLEMGADDYLAKPFNPRELVARIRAILRRTGNGQQDVPASRESLRYQVGDVVLDSGTRLVMCANKTVELTSVEFHILEILLRNVGHVVTREELSQEVLERRLSPYDRSVDVHMSNLRKKLGRENGSRERIKAIRGAGYIYVYPVSSEDTPAPAPNGTAKGLSDA